jgi:putative Mg2+ transporter-C (MgtC) family protein
MLWESANLAFAYVLALPIGWNREREGHSAGLRTFPIVSLAACGFMMLGSAASVATPDSFSRMLQGLITGIGFIGGGAILKDKEGIVTGTATAASIWNIAIVGAAVGLGMYHIAIVLTLINILTLRVLTPVKRQMDQNRNGETSQLKD